MNLRGSSGPCIRHKILLYVHFTVLHYELVKLQSHRWSGGGGEGGREGSAGVQCNPPFRLRMKDDTNVVHVGKYYL